MSIGDSNRDIKQARLCLAQLSLVLIKNDRRILFAAEVFEHGLPVSYAKRARLPRREPTDNRLFNRSVGCLINPLAPRWRYSVSRVNRRSDLIELWVELRQSALTSPYKLNGKHKCSSCASAGKLSSV